MSDDEKARQFFQEWAEKFDLAALLREVVEKDDCPFVEIEIADHSDEDRLSLTNPSNWGVEVETYYGTFCDPDLVERALGIRKREVCPDPAKQPEPTPALVPQRTGNREPLDG